MKNVHILHSHPLSESLPMMSAAALYALCDDIAEHGQREPIVLYEGKILDGRNRYAACVKLGIEPRAINYEGDSPLDFVLSQNVTRRHLTESQKAAVAVRVLPLYEARAKERQRSGLKQYGATTSLGDPVKSRDVVGHLFGVSGRYVQEAKRLLAADPDTFKLVFNGLLPLSRARRLAAKRKPAPTRTGGARIQVFDVLTGRSKGFLIPGADYESIFARAKELLTAGKGS